MTLRRFPTRPFEQSFNNLVDDFFYNSPSLYRNGANAQVSGSNAPVNIRKTDAGYELQVVAPGFEKEAFRIDLEQNLLTISAEHKTEEGQKGQQTIRREFRFQSFKRSFTIDEGIDTDKIEARYQNGILVLNLPKKTEVKEPVKQITIL